jgi:GT2 family glycosyltransferase
MVENRSLSIVIVTYNRCEDLRECLGSLFSADRSPDEVIVVDSCSTDGTVEFVEQYPVKLFRIEERSMVKARNVGLKQASGDVVAYIDDDVVVSRYWSRRLLESYKDGNVAAVGGRVLPYGSKETFYVPVKDAAIGKVLDNGFVVGNFDTPLQQEKLVDSLIGCNMSFRKELLMKAGGFDENFKGTCYRDDTDVCLRLKRQGYKIIFSPKALVWHKYRGKVADPKWFYWTAYNHSYFYLKNFQPMSLKKALAFSHSTFCPPRDYVKKSGIRIKPHPVSIAGAFLGFAEAVRVYRSTRGNWNAAKR